MALAFTTCSLAEKNLAGDEPASIFGQARMDFAQMIARMQNEHRGARPQLVERLNLPVQPPGLPQARVFQESIVQGNEEVESEETLSFYDNYGYGDDENYEYYDEYYLDSFGRSKRKKKKKKKAKYSSPPVYVPYEYPTRQQGESNTLCWKCHVSVSTYDYGMTDLYKLCLAQGELEYCGMGQNYCQIEERQRGGHIYQLKSGCKQPQACMVNWATNFRNETDPECDPGSMHYSVCRQCCGGDNADCNFQRFDDPSQRFTTEADWDDESEHGFLSPEMIGDPGFDPSTFNKTLSWEDYNNQNYENKYSGNYRTSESEMQMDSFGSSFDEEIEETTTTSTTTTTTTTTTTEELTTVYEYEEPVSTSTSLPTTTTLMYIDYDEIDPENAESNALTSLRKIVETLSSQPGGEILKSMSPADLRSLLRALSGQNAKLTDEYDYLGEYFEDYYE